MTCGGKGGSGALLAALLRDCIYSKTMREDLPEELAGIEGLKELYADLVSLRKALIAVGKGDLSHALDAKGYLPGVVKGLQADLKHLTWQTQRIALGDFTQRVDFLGEFSEAFNAMVSHLYTSVKAFNKANAELVGEIEERKAVEAALRESEERFRRLSITDPLTGLHNRRHFFDVAEREAERAHRYGGDLSLCIFDIDSFKAINDTHGHEAGDIALGMIAETSRNMVRHIDLVARYGGEEFVVLFPQTGLAEARAICERVRRAIEATPLPGRGGVIRITASFGVAAFEAGSAVGGATHAESLRALIRRADEALYRAKNSGKNRVEAAA